MKYEHEEKLKRLVVAFYSKSSTAKCESIERFSSNPSDADTRISAEKQAEARAYKECGDMLFEFLNSL